jgi:hypothetical protein
MSPAPVLIGGLFVVPVAEDTSLVDAVTDDVDTDAALPEEHSYSLSRTTTLDDGDVGDNDDEEEEDEDGEFDEYATGGGGGDVMPVGGDLVETATTASTCSLTRGSSVNVDNEDGDTNDLDGSPTTPVRAHESAAAAAAAAAEMPASIFVGRPRCGYLQKQGGMSQLIVLVIWWASSLLLHFSHGFLFFFYTFLKRMQKQQTLAKGLVRSWKVRWFVFDPRTCQLFYYRTRNARGLCEGFLFGGFFYFYFNTVSFAAPLGFVDLTHASLLLLSPSAAINSVSYGYFCVRTTGRDYRLMAENQLVMMQWLHELQVCPVVFGTFCPLRFFFLGGSQVFLRPADLANRRGQQSLA